MLHRSIVTRIATTLVFSTFLSTMAVYAANRVAPPRSPKAKAAVKAAVADKLPPTEKQWAQRWMKPMTLHDLIAQLIVITSYGEAPGARTAAYRDFVHQVRDVRVGGIIVVNRV